MTSSTTTHVNSGRRPHFYIIFMLLNYLVYSCTYVYLRVLNQYSTHWNKNTPTTAMICTVGQLKPPLIVTGNKFNHANDPQTSRKIVYVYFYCVHETQLMRESCMTFSLCINSHVNKINTSQSELLLFVAYWAYSILTHLFLPQFILDYLRSPLFTD